MIADTAFKNIPEHDDRAAGSGKGDAKAAALAGVVRREMRFGISRAAVFGRREEQPGAIVFLARLLGGDAVALVEPGGEYRPVGIEADGLETLALIVRGDRPRRRKALAAVHRARGEHLAVEGLVPEDRER